MVGLIGLYSAKLIRAIDGDTFELLLNLGLGIFVSTTCRLKNIDTPELRARDPIERQRAVDAKLFAERMLKDKNLRMRTWRDKKGKYGRYLCEIFVDGKMISRLLRENGHEKGASHGEQSVIQARSQEIRHQRSAARR